MAIYLNRKERNERDTQIIYHYVKTHNIQVKEPVINQNRSRFSFREFDPNQVQKEALIAFGVPVYLADRIERYRKAGGKFREKSDLNKIYGMKSELFNAMAPYIVLQKEDKRVDHEFSGAKAIAPPMIDLNNADTLELKSIRGIGSKLSARILSYRNSLGFYHKKEQLKEVWGISDSLYLAIRNRFSDPEMIDTMKLNINELNQRAFKKHPYFRRGKIAGAIVNYRNQHGPYQSIHDLLNIHLISDSIFHCIEPYICVDGHQQKIDR